jgi:hypothetical protein
MTEVSERFTIDMPPGCWCRDLGFEFGVRMEKGPGKGEDRLAVRRDGKRDKSSNDLKLISN